MSRGPNDDYVDVATRIVEFRTKHPEGSLQSEIVSLPFDGFLAVKAYAYRSPEDPRPGVGLAWEPVPGPTPFTKNSELQNAETSAWGRAIIAAGAADAKRGVASAEDIRNRQAETQPPPVDEITQEQIDDLNTLTAKVGDDAVKKVCDWANVPTLSDLTGSQAKAVIEKWTAVVAEAAAAQVADGKAA